VYLSQQQVTTVTWGGVTQACPGIEPVDLTVPMPFVGQCGTLQPSPSFFCSSSCKEKWLLAAKESGTPYMPSITS